MPRVLNKDAKHQHKKENRKSTASPRQAHPLEGILAITSMEAKGLYYTNGGQHEKISGPFTVPHRVRDTDGRSYGVIVQWASADGPQEVLINAKRFADPAKEIAKDFLDLGLDIHPKQFDNFVEYIRVCAKLAPLVRFTKEIGWCGEDVFVLPDTVISAGDRDGDEDDQVIADPSISRAHRFKTSGTPEQWRDKLGMPCIGNSRLLMSASCGFAGTILAIMGEASSGVHLKSKSSDGKTTTLRVGGSVLGGGDPKDGFIRSWLSTGNALERTANAHNHTTMFLDELSQIDPREAQRAVYTIANGTGRARLDRELFQRPVLQWQLIFVSSGEVSLADHAGQRTKGGAEIRMLDIPADAGAGMGVFENLHGAASAAAFAIQLNHDALHYYGWPIRDFIERLIELGPEEVRNKISCWSAKFIDACKLDNASAEVGRAAKPMALIASAGAMASEFGITGWQPMDAIYGVKKCFDAWRAQRGGDTVAHDDQQYIRMVRLFIQQHENSRFEPIVRGQRRSKDKRQGLLNPKNFAPEDGPAMKEGFLNRAGFRATSANADDATEYWIFPEVFTTEICKGFSAQVAEAALAALDKHGFLHREHPALTRKPYIPQMGKSIRMVAVRDAILAGDE